ncbi:MAG: hypothetical protein ACLPTB_06410 [Acidimicrobiales bacterium]
MTFAIPRPEEEAAVAGGAMSEVPAWTPASVGEPALTCRYPEGAGAAR